MASIWDNIADTAKSLGSAAGAPAGVLWDLASGANPLDDEDFDISNSLMRRGGQLLDPVLNQETFTGYGADKVMDAANWTMDNVVSEPISTAFTQVQHAAQGDTVG